METVIKDRLETISDTFAKSLNLEIVELNIKRRSKTIVIEIFADRPEGGIVLDECALLNKLIAQKLEVENFIDDDYVIEVSSPGLDRPLKSSKDLSRVVGANLRFHLTEPLEGKVEHSGIVQEVNDENVTIQTKQKIMLIPISIIHKAFQIID